MKLLLSIIAVLCVPALAEEFCMMDKGTYGLSCTSYTECTSGVGTTIECGEDELLEFESVPPKCRDSSTFISPCHHVGDCSGDNINKTVVVPGTCQFYYKCHGSIPGSVMPCLWMDDTKLVFDESIQGCNFSWLVSSPCGNA